MRFAILYSCLFALSATAGCGRNPTAGTTIPDQLTLYSVDPDSAYAREEKDPEGKELFHGYLVLGKIDVTDASQRREIMTALRDGFAQSDGSVYKCFDPRHAVRAVENGKTVDYLICFHCKQAEVHEGNSHRVVPTTRDPQAKFNEILTKAGVPLPPKDGD